MPDHDGHPHDHDHAHGDGHSHDAPRDGGLLLEDPADVAAAERGFADAAAPPEPPDPGQQSLADALQFSFVALKAIMVLLLIGYAFSGVFPVDEQEVAVRLRFGEIVGEDRIYQQGWHFGLPVPIEDRVEVSTASQTVTVRDAFWYELTENQETLTRAERAQQITQPLNPEVDGSLLTGDANIVHGRFTAAFRVPGDDAEAVINFVQNVGDMDRARELVLAAVEQGAVYAAAQSTADDFINNAERVRILARQRAQQVLDAMQTGLRIDTLSATTDMPNAVIQAFNAVSEAESQRGKLIDEARQEATQTLGATAGEAAEGLFDLVRAYELARSAQDQVLAPQLDALLSYVFDRLRVPVAVPGLLELVRDYGEARAEGDDTRAQEIAGEIEQRVEVVTALDPRRQLAEALESYAVALQAGRDAEADRLAIEIENRLGTMTQFPGIDAVESAYETLRDAESGEARAEASLGVLAQADALVEAAEAEGEAIGGEVAQAIFQAQGYRTRIVNQVQAEAERFERLLDEYRQNPRIVASRLWQTSRERIFTSPGVETIYSPAGDLRLDINRDPEVQRQREEAALQQDDEQDS